MLGRGARRLRVVLLKELSANAAERVYGESISLRFLEPSDGNRVDPFIQLLPCIARRVEGILE